MTKRNNGELVSEDFAEDITLTLQFPEVAFDGFQNDLRELSAGKLKVEVIETKETTVALQG